MRCNGKEFHDIGLDEDRHLHLCPPFVRRRPDKA